MSSFYRYQDSGLDDWDKQKNYLQMGFRPGFAIQARELTQMQTIMQAQISLMGTKLFGNGGLVDINANLQGPSNGGTGVYDLTLSPGHIFIKPENKEIGYCVYSSNTLTLSGISNFEGEQARVYLSYEEVQVNPDGEEYDSMGGFAKVTVDSSLSDNAQGFTNYSAPGSSRYQINILSISYYIQGEGMLPPNSVEIIYYKDNSPYFSGNQSLVPINV